MHQPRSARLQAVSARTPREASSTCHLLPPSGPSARTPRTFCSCAMTPCAVTLARTTLSSARGQVTGAAGCRCPWSGAPLRYLPEEQAGRSRRSPRQRRPRLHSALGAPNPKRASPAPAPPAGPPAPLSAGSVIGWRCGSLARACGCSYKNPRVPALSCSKSATALPSAARAPPERSGCGHSKEAGGGEPAGRPYCLPLKDLGDREEGDCQTSKNCNIKLPESHFRLPVPPSGLRRRRAWTRCC